MREAYLPPELIRVASVEDLTLSGGGSSFIDVCITIGGTIGASIGVVNSGPCS
ncbi:MAG TPA: lasso RiPP family leader peptide-containing protein [Mycobacteriales bacterium]|nr:lasso RiPP family leader peptide-containing protein [Mycobacteriales bacterium]